MRWPKKQNNPPTKQKQNKTNKEGLGPNEVDPWATSVWPLNPQKKTKKQQNIKKNKKKKNQNILKNELFSYQSNFSFFCGWVSKISLFDNLAQKARTLKTLKIWVSANFSWRKHMRHETAIFGPKKQNPEIPVIIFCLFSSLSTTRNTKNCWTPYFYSVLANLKKRIFKI